MESDDDDEEVTEEIRKLAAQRYLQGVRSSVDGMLPLQWELQSDKPSWGVAKALLAAYPEAAGAVGPAGWLPLHWAAMKQAPPSVVQALLLAHPQLPQPTPF